MVISKQNDFVGQFRGVAERGVDMFSMKRGIAVQDLLLRGTFCKVIKLRRRPLVRL